MLLSLRSTLFRGTFGVAGFLIGSASGMWAQGAAVTMPSPGSRIRIQMDGSPVAIVGSLASATDDSLSYVRPTTRRGSDRAIVQDTVAIPRSAVRALETSTGPHRHVARSLGWGFAGGAGAGALVGAATYSPCTATGFLACMFEPRSRGEAALWGATAGAFLGTVGGLLVGVLHQSDDWHRVPIERVAQLRLVPRPGGVGVSLSVSLP